MFCRVLGISYISDNSFDKIDNLTFLPTTVNSFVSFVCVITLFRTFITKINRIWVQEFYLAPELSVEAFNITVSYGICGLLPD